jgi:uncharacterized protein (DUF2062 family)
MGILPFWGYQMLLAAFLAHLFKLNKTITLIASNISIPPMVPVILIMSFKTGSWILGTDAQINITNFISFSDLKDGLVQYLVGSIGFAAITSVSIGLISLVLLEMTKKNRV